MFVVWSCFLSACGSDKSIYVFNPPPEATITSHQDGQQVDAYTAIELRASVWDSNDDVQSLQTTWYENGTVICGPQAPDGNGDSFCELMLSNQSMGTIVVEVKDSKLAAGTDQVALQVIENQPPTALIVEPVEQDRYYANVAVSLVGMAADAEDTAQQLQVAWSSDIAGVIGQPFTVDADGHVSTEATLQEGTHLLELQVTDSVGLTASASVAIVVGSDNTTPSCSITAPVNGAVGAVGEVVSLLGQAADSDISTDQLQASWYSDKDGWLGDSSVDSSGQIGFSATNLSVNTHLIELQVVDEVGAQCVKTVEYKVGAPPVIAIQAPLSGQVINQGDAVEAIVHVSDQEDAADEIMLSWQLDGVVVSNQPASVAGIAQVGLTEPAIGQHTLDVTAVDQDGLETSQQVEFVINGLPSAPQLTLAPDPATTADDLIVTATGSVDPEGDPITYLYSWYHNGVLTSQQGATIASSSTTKGDTWRVEVTPSDGLGLGTPASISRTIVNTAPALSGLAITPNPVYNDDLLYCSAQAIDLEDGGLQPNYVWENITTGQQLSSTENVQLDPNLAMPGEVLRCHATATDSDGVSTSDQLDITVENRPPVVSSIGFSSNVVYTSDTLAALAVFSDADEPNSAIVSASYEWHVIDAQTGVDSVVQTGSVVSLAGSLHFDRDDQVYVIVTPFDGQLYGTASTSATIAIANSPPTTPVVSISPSSAALGDDLNCQVSAVTDADGDAIVYTYTWTDEQSTIQQTTVTTSPNDVFTSVSTAGTWTCRVQPSDGTDVGPTESASVEVETENTLEATISVDHDAVFADIAVSLDGSRVYVTRVFHDDVLVLSSEDLSLLTSISVPSQVTAIKISVDGTKAYAVINAHPGKIAVIDIDPSSATYHTVLSMVSLGYNGALGVGVHPDGNQIFATTQRPAPGRIHLLNSSETAVAHTIEPAAGGANAVMEDIVFKPSGDKGFSSVFQSASSTNVVVFSPSTLAVTGFIDLQLSYQGGGPGNMAAVNGSAGAQLWVANNSWVTEGFTVVDMDTESVLLHEDFPTGGGSIPGICVHPDQSQVFFALSNSPILVYDPLTLSQSHSYTQLDQYCDCTISPDGHYLYITTMTGPVYKVDIDSLQPN